MVQLQAQQEEFEKLGLKLVGLSYDRPEILQEFAQRAGITFPLLADPDSSSLEKLGLVNPEGKGKSKGVAFPGILYLDSDGKIQETFFEDSYAKRPTPGTVLARLFPESGASPEPTGGKEYVLTQTGAAGIAGSEWELVVSFPLAEKAHLYAPGSENYYPLELKLEPHPMLEFGEAILPPSETLRIEVLNEEVEVYSGVVTLRVPVTVRLNDATKALKAAESTTVEGELSYQICNDRSCLPPQSEKVSWKVEVRPLDRQRSSEQWQH